jgi:hypothetical protein
MPSYAIKSSGIRQVAANSLIGNSTGSTGSAEELSANDAKTLLGLGSSDSPTFAGLDVTNWLTIDGSNFLVETPSGTGSDARIRIDNGEPRVELYSYSGSTSPFLRMGGATPGSSVSTSIRHFETGGNHYLNIGDKDGSARWCFSHVGDEFFLSHSGGAIGWSGTYRQAYDASPDTTLFRDDANILALRNGVNAMAFRIYNTDDGSQTNYGRALIGWDSNVNGLFVIDVEASGTGTQGTLAIRRGGQNRISFPSNSSVTIHKSLYPSSNGSVYNGWSSLRWANVYSVKSDISQLLTVGGDVSMPNLPTSDPASAGLLWNDSGTLKVSAG